MHLLSLIIVCAMYLVINTSGQFISTTSRPERCAGNPDVLNRFCCILPPFFTREVAKDCGAGVIGVQVNVKIPSLRRHAFSRCSYWLCVLNTYRLINRKGYVDHEKYFTHLDVWASLNPSFTGVMLDAKVNCKQTYRFYMPLKPCEFSGLNMCIRNFLQVECPQVIQTKECEEQKSYYKVCGKYYYKK